MKIELDEKDKSWLAQELSRYAWDSLREETSKIIKEHFKLLFQDEFRKIAKETVENIFVEENIDLKKMLKQRLLDRSDGPATRRYCIENIVKNFVDQNLDQKLPELFKDEQDFLQKSFNDTLKTLFTYEIRRKLGIHT